MPMPKMRVLMKGRFPVGDGTHHYLSRIDDRGRELRVTVVILPGSDVGYVELAAVIETPDQVRAERNMVVGLLREEDEDARQALAALWRLDRSLPEDKEAVIEVEAKQGKPQFTVTTRDRR